MSTSVTALIVAIAALLGHLPAAVAAIRSLLAPAAAARPGQHSSNSADPNQRPR